MNRTLRYLVRETGVRWRTRPLSPATRLVLTFLLTATAAGFLTGFETSTNALKTELYRLGFDTAVIRQPRPDIGANWTGSTPDGHWAAPLAADGKVSVLRQTPLLAQTPWGRSASVFTVPWSMLARLIPEGSQAASVWLTRDWPAGRIGSFSIARSIEALPAIAVNPEGPLSGLIAGDALLVPVDLLPAGLPGSLDITLVTADEPARLTAALGAVRQMFAAEPGPAPMIQDPSPLRASLSTLERGQRAWGAAVLALLGTGVVLVYAAIAVLEYRETRFSQALLRSMGVRRRLLWSASLLENLLLANIALATALFTVQRVAASVLSHLPAAQASSDFSLSVHAVIFLALVINTGVIISLIPLGRSLGQPVGTQLS